MIIVFGSINLDMTVAIPRMPHPGETVVGPGFESSPGGKGANQALAALRSGAKVALVGKIGDDGIGARMMTGLRRDGVITSGVAHSDTPTGTAMVIRDSSGENRIIVGSGANAEATADQIPDEVLKPDNIVLMQMETPHKENWLLLARARHHGTTTILNAAPAAAIPREVLRNIDILIVNQLEAQQLADHMKLDSGHDIVKVAESLSRLGGLTCIVTLGAKGAMAWTKEGKPVLVAALALDSVEDTTGAGDAFCGTLAAALHGGFKLEDAMKRACVAGSLACLKKGAQTSFPYLGEIEQKLAEL
jgi:ribokinase